MAVSASGPGAHDVQTEPDITVEPYHTGSAVPLPSTQGYVSTTYQPSPGRTTNDTMIYTIPPSGPNDLTSMPPPVSQSPSNQTTTRYTKTIIPPPSPAAVVQNTQQTQTFTVVAPVGLMPKLGRKSVRCTCPYCKNQIVTRLRDQFDECTITAIVLLVLFFWPLFWVPMVSPECKTTEHYCTHCGMKLGETKACE